MTHRETPEAGADVPKRTKVWATRLGVSSDWDISVLPSRASAPIPDDLANTFQRMAGAEDVVVYEARGAESLCYPVEFTTERDYPTLPLRGPLVRWCRVNGELLRLPRQADVLAGATEAEKAFVASASIRACVPLLANQTLVGLVILLDTRTDWTLSDECAQALLLSARQVAPKWRNARGTHDAIGRARAEYRSQQLSLAGELAATAAHEIRNPLAAIRSLVQFVRDVEPSADERTQLLGEVLEEVDRADRTVGNLLELSRPHATLQALMDAGDVLSRAIQFIAPYARKRQLNLSQPRTAGSLPVVGDPNELRQVIVNVLLNACQASAPGGQIVASASAVTIDGAPFAEIVIADTGHGVAGADVARVFDPFFTTKPEGTGLGLAICREVLQRHRGTITLTSTPNVGTDVVLRLPLN